MELNISNPIEAIYLNAFPLSQNIRFQIVATWVHLSTHPLISINLSPFKLQKAQSSERLPSKYYMSMVKHSFFKSPVKEIYFSH